MDTFVASTAAYARAAMLEDQCETMRCLADELRQAADVLAYRAYDLQQAAFIQRKRSAELSGHLGSTSFSPSGADEGSESLEKGFAQAAELEYHGKEIQSHLKLIVNADGMRKKSTDMGTADESLAESETRAKAAMSKILSQFTARISPESRPDSDNRHRTKLPHQRIVKSDGSPYYQPTTISTQRHRSDAGWPSVNTDETQATNKTCSSPLGMDEATAAGLMQYVDRQDWNLQELILRKAHELERSRTEERPK